MRILSFIRIVAIFTCILYALTIDQITKRLDKPFFLRLMRILCAVMFAAFLYFSCIGLLNTFDYARKLLETHELNIPELLWLIPLWFIIVVTFLWRKGLWFFIRSDKDTILSGWYIEKHLDLNKQRKFDESYHCLQKASEIKPDSLQTWCLLASFAQLFLENPEQADQYLAKARETLNSKSSENPKEAAIVESYYGFIMQHRNEHQAALEHMKKAYELDPKRFRKEQYEEALELSRQEENSTACKESE